MTIDNLLAMLNNPDIVHRVDFYDSLSSNIRKYII